MGLCPPNEVPVEPPVGEITIDDAMTLCAGEPSLRVSLCRQDDFEFACAQDDGRLVLVRHTTDEDGVLVISVLEIDGTASTAVPIVCPSKTIEMAPSQVVCVDGVEYTQVPVVDLASLPPAQLATLWFNAVGVIVADPTPGAVSVTLGVCPIVEDVFVPHVNGCIERTTVGAPLVCQSSASTFTFDANDFIQFTVLANDGNGNYTILQEMTPAGQTMLLSILTLLGQDNTRAFEDVGGLFQSYFWEGNFSNVIDLSPTEVQFDVHLEVGVTDTPDALIVPCVDPVSDATYQSAASFQSSIYNAATVGVPEPQGGLVVTFDVTQYSQSGTETVEHIPAKQVVKLLDGLLVETYHVPGDINTEIVFDNATDVFKNVCTDPVVPVDVDYVACDGTTVTQTVDSTVGAYVLNSEYKHTETVYDNVTATVGGTVTTTIAGTNVAFNFAGVIATNWPGSLYTVEFGNGFVDVGGNPSFDFVNEPDGNYELKVYRAFNFPEGLRWFLVAPIEIIKTGSTITVLTTNPLTISRSIVYTSQELLQDYCGTAPVGSPYNVDGSPATITGFLSLSFRDDETEWLGMSDANNGSTVDTFDCVTPGITAAEGADINIQATSAYIGTPVTTYHTQLGSTLNLLGTSSGQAMGSGVEIVSTGSSVQTITFTVEVVNDSDPVSPDADFGICVIDNSTGLVIPATSITGPPLVYDPSPYSGLGLPIYNSLASGNTYVITWTGTIPAGSFTAVFVAQDQIAPGNEDSLNVTIDVPVVVGSTTTAQVVHLDDCTIAALTAEPVPEVEIPGGLVIVNGASLSAIAGTSFVHSFSVKALFGSTYEISFDNGATWSPPIDGADSWGGGTIELVDVTNVVVRPSVNGMTTFVHWEI